MIALLVEELFQVFVEAAVVGGAGAYGRQGNRTPYRQAVHQHHPALAEHLLAADLVQHFEARNATMNGKAMIVAMSREICVKLYDAAEGIYYRRLSRS